METWLIFAIISIFTSGFNNFFQKVAAERDYDIWLLNIYTYLVGVLSFWFYLIVNFDKSILENIYPILFLWLLNAIFALSWKNTKIESLKHMDTVIFFPLYKTFWPIIITLISVYFYNEWLTVKEIFWIGFWILVPLLLISSSEKKRQKNLFLWLLFLVFATVLTSIWAAVNKEVMLNQYNISVYIFIVFTIQVIISIWKYKIWKMKKIKYNKEWIIKFWILSWILSILAKIVFIKMLEWNLAVAFTINSFSILIPIVLSIIFYKDHFDFKKWLVIALSIISIILFI